MPNKTEEYLALACKTADSFSRQWEHWAEFLITAARLYKYSYPDQLMIYAQRPDATACAEYDVWNNKMNRYVRRGSKGIALLDESGGYPRLHYVFDVSDTAPRRNALYPDLWQINESLKEPVRSMLAENYGVHSESFGQQLADVAGKLVQSYEVNEVPTTPEVTAAEEGLNEEGAPELAGNFRITDEELGAGGPKQKFARNIKAIKTLFTLEQEHRGATAEEQQVLSQYVGWGGLADAFDPDKSSWAKEYAELKGLLSEEEYKAARGSVLNAHYTSPTVIRAIMPWAIPSRRRKRGWPKSPS